MLDRRAEKPGIPVQCGQSSLLGRTLQEPSDAKSIVRREIGCKSICNVVSPRAFRDIWRHLVRPSQGTGLHVIFIGTTGLSGRPVRPACQFRVRIGFRIAAMMAWKEECRPSKPPDICRHGLVTIAAGRSASRFRTVKHRRPAERSRRQCRRVGGFLPATASGSSSTIGFDEYPP